MGYLIKEGHNVWQLLLYASLGNNLGGMSCYYIARFGGRSLLIKVFKMEEEKIVTWEKKLTGKSEWTAAFAWLPFVGEFIAAGVGLVSPKQVRVFIYMFIGKALRYFFVLKVVQKVL